MIMIDQRKAAKARHEQQEKQGGTVWLITAIMIMLCAEPLVSWVLGSA